MITFLAEAAASQGALDTIKDTFGWHPAYFIAQVVNFFLVVFVLKKFAFGPIQEILNQRRTRIEEGEEKLKRIEKQLAESEATTAATIEKANADALRLVNEAKEGAEALTEQKTQEATAQAKQILAKAEAAGNADRERISAELKREFGRLVTATTSQVTGKVLTSDDQARINEEAISKVSN